MRIKKGEKKMEENKYLKAAKIAREENNTADAKRYYEMVKMDDPENAEAKFFYAYYTITEGTKGEAYDNYVTFINTIGPSVKAIARSDMSDAEKQELLADMAKTAKKMPTFIYNVLNSIGQTQHCRQRLEKGNQNSISMLYIFGDEIESAFSDNKNIMENIAADLWKSAIALQRQWVGVSFNKSYPDKYEAKIQKYIPSYKAPAKNKLRACIAAILKFGS